MKKGMEALLLLMLCTGLVYSNHFDNSFHFDDSHTIVSNTAIRDLENIPRFFSDASTFSSLPANQSYRPVVTTLNAIDYALTGENKLNTFWYHLSIFISFLLSGVLLFLFLKHLLKKMILDGFSIEIPLFITGWFWLHPANAETINYIIARSDSFSTFMLLLAFVMYTNWPVAQKYHLYLLPFAAAFLAKETAIMFLPLLFLYEIFFVERMSLKEAFASIRKTGGMARRLMPVVAVSAGLLFLYKQMLPASWKGGGDYSGLEYIMTQPFALLHYFKNFFIPLNLVADADWQPVTSVADHRFWTGLLFLLLLLLTAWWTSVKEKYRLISFGLLWFFLALLPVSLVPLAELKNDHRTFFPYIGLFIAFAGFLQWLFTRSSFTRYKKNRYILQATVLVFFGWLAFATRQRNTVWHSEYSLWKEVTVKAPKNGRGWMNYGITQMAAGDFAGAEASYKEAISLTPSYAYIYINMGVLKDAEKKYEEAESNFKTALSLDPGSPEGYARYAEFLLKQGKLAEASLIISKGLAISPGHALLNELRQQAGINQ